MEDRYEKLMRAAKLALELHQGEVRKISKAPYIVHPIEVAVIVSSITEDLDVICAALLHDTVEDTPETIEQIEAQFGSRIAALIASETEDKKRDRPAAETWMERKQESLEGLENSTDINVKILWLGDKLSNLRSLARAFRHSGNELWSVFNQTDPKQHEWYYRSIARILEPQLGQTFAYRELRALIEEVFGTQNEN